MSLYASIKGDCGTSVPSTSSSFYLGHKVNNSAPLHAPHHDKLSCHRPKAEGESVMD